MYDSELPSSPVNEPLVRMPPSLRGDSVARVRFEAGETSTHIADLYQLGSLRVRFPRVGRCEAVLLNTGGGITGGDQISIELELGAGAAATVTSQAAEKIYRSDGEVARIRVAAHLASGAKLDWLPQETIVFDRARVQRTIDVEMAGDAVLTMLEMLVVGRVAHGEEVRDASWLDRWRIRRDGKLVFADAVRIGGDVATLLQRPALGAGARAVATLVHIAPGAEQRLDAVRACLDGAPFACAASAWNGMLVARFAAAVPHDLHSIAKAAVCAITGSELPRAWNC